MTILIIGDPDGLHSMIAMEKYRPEDITVWEDQPTHVASIKAICDRINVTNNLDSLHDMHFDVSIANPPYLKNIHLEFLIKLLSISDTVKFIHPAGWLYRNSSKLERQVKELLSGRIKKITLFNGNSVFTGAEFACPLVRLHVVKSHTGPIEVKSDITGNTYYINDLSDFPTGYWEPNDQHLELVDLYKSLSTDTVNNLVSKDNSEYMLSCPRVVGHGKTMSADKYASDDFHIFHYRNSDLKNKGRYDKAFKVNSDTELQSIKSYLETKFARFGLSIHKVSQDSYVKRYFSCVPLPPLDRQWTDESISEYYGLTSDQVNYINEFIPDYY